MDRPGWAAEPAYGSRPPYYVCAHEAGHAAMAHAFGLRCHIKGPCPQLGPSVGARCCTPELARLTWQQEVLLNVAGAVGEQVLLDALSIGCIGDAVRAYDLVRVRHAFAGVCISADEAFRYFGEAYETVVCFLRPYRSSLDRLAQAFEKADVSEDEVATILADVPRFLLPDDSEEGLADIWCVRWPRERARRFTGGPDPGPHPPAPLAATGT